MKPHDTTISDQLLRRRRFKKGKRDFLTSQWPLLTIFTPCLTRVSSVIYWYFLHRDVLFFNLALSRDRLSSVFFIESCSAKTASALLFLLFFSFRKSSLPVFFLIVRMCLVFLVSLFNMLHKNDTWFISCVYFVFVNQLINQGLNAEMRRRISEVGQVSAFFFF